MATTYKKIAKNKYEVTETKQVTEKKIVNIVALQDEILELEEKKIKIDTELSDKKELLIKLNQTN